MAKLLPIDYIASNKLMHRSSEYFAKVASHWDTIRQGYFDESVTEKVRELAVPTTNTTAVDLGTGTGFVAAALARRAKRLIGIDVSNEMIKVARKKLEDEDIRNVDMIVGSAEQIPLKSDSVELVVGNMVLHHIPEPQAAFAEMHRILKKGGKLVLTDLDKHGYEWFRKEMADLWLGFEREEIRRWMRQTGFSALKVDCADNNCCTKAPGTESEVKVSIFYAYGEKT